MPAVLLQRVSLRGDADLGAELPGLDRCPVGQLRSRDPGGEAQVVLDPRRGAGLTAGRDCVDGDGLQALGCSIDRGGESGRTRADHDEVDHVVRRYLCAQPKGPRELDVARVAQYSVAPDHHRRLFGRDLQRVQQRLGVVARVEIDPSVGQAVAGCELAQAPRVQRVRRPDDPQPGAEPDQHRTARYVGMQDQVAEAGILGDHLPQLLDRNLQYLPRFAHDRRQKRSSAQQEVELAEKAARAWTPTLRSSAMVSTLPASTTTKG